jgi:L-alanine-DL-glutamate epimerase-like enolase superfamily enzyme
VKLILHEANLPIRHPWTTSHGTRTHQRNLIVELSDGGHSGYGEGASIPYYGVTYDTMSAALQAVRAQIEDASIDDPAAFWEVMRPLLSNQMFALCALDEAANDLWGKRQGRAVHDLWGLDMALAPMSDYTIGIDTVEKMVQKMDEFPGWPIYKIKLGTDKDIEIVRELRKHTGAVFRVDANCGWDAEQTVDYACELADLGVEFIEQPLPAEDWDGMERVYAHSVLPVVADESCILEADVDRCAGCFHGVNVKLTKCGGQTPAKRMLARARALGMKTMVGCMTETTVGISAIAQLLPMLDYVDMDGALLLAGDVADGVTLDRGKVHLPDTPGNGVTWRGLPEA